METYYSAVQRNNSATSLVTSMGTILYVEPSLWLNQKIAMIITELNRYSQLPPHPLRQVHVKRLHRQSMLRHCLTELEQEKQRHHQRCNYNKYFLNYFHSLANPHQEITPMAEIDYYKRFTSFLDFDDDSFLTPWNFNNPNPSTTTTTTSHRDDDDIIGRDHQGRSDELSTSTTDQEIFRDINDTIYYPPSITVDLEEKKKVRMMKKKVFEAMMTRKRKMLGCTGHRKQINYK